MKEHILKYNVKEIAMPQIGIGLDRLEWGKVKEIIYDLFSDTNIRMIVYKWKEGNDKVKTTFKNH